MIVYTLYIISANSSTIPCFDLQTQTQIHISLSTQFLLLVGSVLRQCLIIRFYVVDIDLPTVAP